MTRLAALLKQLRLMKGYSLREVQKRSRNQVSHGYLHVIEKGCNPDSKKLVRPSIKVLRVLAEVYDYPFQQLLKTAGYPYSKQVATNEEQNGPTRKKLHLEQILAENEIYFAGELLNDADKRAVEQVLNVLWSIFKEREKKNTSKFCRNY